MLESDSYLIKVFFCAWAWALSLYIYIHTICNLHMESLLPLQLKDITRQQQQQQQKPYISLKLMKIYGYKNV